MPILCITLHLQPFTSVWIPYISGDFQIKLDDLQHIAIRGTSQNRISVHGACYVGFTPVDVAVTISLVLAAVQRFDNYINDLCSCREVCISLYTSNFRDKLFESWIVYYGAISFSFQTYFLFCLKFSICIVW